MSDECYNPSGTELINAKMTKNEQNVKSNIVQYKGVM